MPGLYVHIPFCLQACYYCDFHYKARTDRKPDMLKAIQREASLRCGEWSATETGATWYFGGGTPTVLSAEEWAVLKESLSPLYPCHGEWTVEANPEDLTPDYLSMLKQLGVNRLSIGIQSFDDGMLRWMHRRHTAERAVESVRQAQAAGFENLSIDLRYGIPGMTVVDWRCQLEQAAALHVPHLSAYHLTLEPRTVFGVRLRQGKMAPVQEEESERQYTLLTSFLADNGYEHYEISNFAQPGYRAVHNSGYWTGVPYVGLGPSAHSYDGNSRRWNIASNDRYIQGVQTGDETWFQTETLSDTEKYDEYVMTRLRTSDGMDLQTMAGLFGEQRTAECLRDMEKYLRSGQIQPLGGTRYRIAEHAWLTADSIIADLFAS